MKSKYCQILDKNLEITVARSIDQIENIRSIWEEMQSNESYPIINADIDRYISVIKALNNGVQPYVVLFKRDCRPEMMVIGRIEKHPLKLKLGYKTLFSPILRSLTIEHGGILGQPTSDIYALLISELTRVLRHHEVDMVFFNHLSVDSPLYQLTQRMPGLLTRGRFPKIQPHWMLSVPNQMELFYKSCSHTTRRQLRRYVKNIEKAFPGQVKVITYCKEDELDDAIKAASAISVKTYQYALEAGFADNFRTRTLLSAAAKRGWLRASVLFVNNSPCAFQFALKYKQTYFMDQMGFDPEWKDFRVGMVLFVKTMEEICRDSTVNTVDFYVGDAEYKRRYCDKHVKRASIYIFAPRLYPIFVNILQSSIMGLSLGLECAFNRIGFLGRIKQSWRNLLRNGSDG